MRTNKMSRRLNIKKVIPCIEEYIREAYKQSEAGKRGEPLVIRGSYAIRDIVLVALCGKAIGRDNIHAVFHKRPGAKDCIPQLGIDFDEIQLLSSYVKEISEVYVLPNSLTSMAKQKLIYHLDDNVKNMNLDSLTRALGFIHDIVFIETHPELLTAAPFNFGHALLYCELYDKVDAKIYSEMKKHNAKRGYKHYMHNVLLPLYPFTDDEVYLIGMHLGINGVFNGIIPPDYISSFNYRDTPVERAVKISNSIRMNLDKLDQGYLINLMMECAPRFTNCINDLTYFFMGECYGCYESVTTTEDKLK